MLMKKRFGILLLLAAATLPGGCTSGSIGPDTAARARMQVEVIAGEAGAHDLVHTVRFLVFDDASARPALDVNELVTLTPQEQEATAFRVVLEVNCNRDKLVAVVVNEPEALSPALGSVVSPSELEELEFRMADAFDDGHAAPLATGLPMTGVKRGFAVTAENVSQADAAKVKVQVLRAVARVELWLAVDAESTAALNASTGVSLLRSHDAGLLFGPDVDNGFGRLATVAAPSLTVGWQYAATDPLPLTETPQLVCAFYTPERSCSAPDDADKLVLRIQGVDSPGGARNAETVLSEFAPEGGSPQPLEAVLRNRVYRITGRVGSAQFEHTVVPWSDAGQGIVIDPQYFLRVDRDRLHLPGSGDEEYIQARTDYDRDDRGFPRGIRIGRIRYYDNSGAPVAGDDDGPFGWLAVTPGSPEGALEQRIRFAAGAAPEAAEQGCYATVEIRAGNLARLIRITR